ncbi:bub2 protein [Mrakia frigida]|uniref:Bub2p n=1 Tax=Mrakia frigida TaxID=29902 RepID=UPI003FCC0C49
MSASSALSLTSSASDSPYDQLSYLLAHPNLSESRKHRPTSELVAENHKRLRRGVLADGIPEGEVAGAGGRPSLRPTTWKIFLRIPEISSAVYLSYVAKGKSSVHEKITNDAFRTLATDQDFKDKVSEEALVRLLDAFAWSHLDTFTYVQGMNVLAAPFLYTLPSEIEAFYCFSAFIEECCPLYVSPTLKGVHDGLALLDKCLNALDPELYEYLRKKNLSAELYAFPSVLTLCACTPPLDEVIQLWDFLLAYGVHLNILCVIAQLLQMREEVMESISPMKILRQFPPLKSRTVIAMTVLLVRDLPEDLYAELVRHPRGEEEGEVLRMG